MASGKLVKRVLGAAEGTTAHAVLEGRDQTLEESEPPSVAEMD
jgi:hypothetical protein